MKTILINIPDSYFVRSFLRTEAIEIFKKRDDIRVIFLTDPLKLSYYRGEFSAPNFEFIRKPEDLTKNKIETFFKFIETASIKTRTTDIIQKTEFSRSKYRLPVKLYRFLLKRIYRQLGAFRWWRKFIRFSYDKIITFTYTEIFKKYQPDLVYNPTTLYEDNRIVKEAKRERIKVIGQVLSWDNFYSKSFLLSQPDHLLVHTRKIKEQATEVGDFPESKITVVGIPQYDRYFTKKGIIPREQFIQSIGGDPNKKLICYAFSGKVGFPLDTGIIRILGEAIKEGKIEGDVDILVRPYPRYDFDEKLDRFNRDYGFLGKPAMAHVGNGVDDWEFDQDSIDLLANTLAHSDLIITMYSTFFIEGAIFNKPLVGIRFDEKDNLPYHGSAKRFFDWDHLRDIKNKEGIDIVTNKEEFIDAVNRGLRDSDERKKGREEIVKQQAEFTDGKSAKRIVDAIIGQLE